MHIDEILRRVASGELTPEQALPLLDTASAHERHRPGVSGSAGDGSADSGSRPPREAAPPPLHEPGRPGETATVPVTGVRIHAGYRSIEVIGDPAVAQLAVSGDHTVQRQGEILIVTGQAVPSVEDLLRSPGFRFTDLPRGLAWARRLAEQRLVVRVNPELRVDLECSGANATVSSLVGEVRIRAMAAALKLERLRARLDLETLTASVKGSITPLSHSRIVAESSSVKLLLEEGSDLVITAHNRMGKVVLPEMVTVPRDGEGEPVTVVLGAGRDRLEVEARMSSVTLTADTTVSAS